MSQDIIADALNGMMMSLSVGKREVKIPKISKVLIKLLEMMKTRGHIDFSVDENDKKPFAIVKFIKLNKCSTVKPRYSVMVEDIDKYARRFLPSRNLGVLIVSTSKGLMTHHEAVEQNLGGSLMAYFY